MKHFVYFFCILMLFRINCYASAKQQLTFEEIAEQYSGTNYAVLLTSPEYQHLLDIWNSLTMLFNDKLRLLTLVESTYKSPFVMKVSSDHKIDSFVEPHLCPVELGVFLSKSFSRSDQKAMRKQLSKEFQKTSCFSVPEITDDEFTEMEEAFKAQGKERSFEASTPSYSSSEKFDNAPYIRALTDYNTFSRIVAHNRGLELFFLYRTSHSQYKATKNLFKDIAGVLKDDPTGSLSFFTVDCDAMPRICREAKLSASHPPSLFTLVLGDNSLKEYTGVHTTEAVLDGIVDLLMAVEDIPNPPQTDSFKNTVVTSLTLPLYPMFSSIVSSSPVFVYFYSSSNQSSLALAEPFIGAANLFEKLRDNTLSRAEAEILLPTSSPQLAFQTQFFSVDCDFEQDICSKEIDSFDSFPVVKFYHSENEEGVEVDPKLKAKEYVSFVQTALFPQEEEDEEIGEIEDFFDTYLSQHDAI
eukprot:GCRY01001000.1.p1 GENE.GCRY01001000.1~~GCRY01001000.1.p1  ORF type:complete len:469 (+),score=61.85 GCRY01001000.1:153-1559(+)